MMMDNNRYLIFIEYAPIKDGELHRPPFFNQVDSMRSTLTPLFEIPPNQFSRFSAAANGHQCYVENIAVVDLISGQVPIYLNTTTEQAIMHGPGVTLEVAPGVDRMLMAHIFPHARRKSPEAPASVDLLVPSPNGKELCATLSYHAAKDFLQGSEPAIAIENRQGPDPYLLHFTWTLKVIDGELNVPFFCSRGFSNAQHVVDYTNQLSSALVKGKALQQYGVPLRLKQLCIINHALSTVMVSVSRRSKHSLSVSLAGNLPGDFDHALKSAASNPGSLLSSVIPDNRKVPRKLGVAPNGGQKKPRH